MVLAVAVSPTLCGRCQTSRRDQAFPDQRARLEVHKEEAGSRSGERTRTRQDPLFVRDADWPVDLTAPLDDGLVSCPSPQPRDVRVAVHAEPSGNDVQRRRRRFRVMNELHQRIAGTAVDDDDAVGRHTTGRPRPAYLRGVLVEDPTMQRRRFVIAGQPHGARSFHNLDTFSVGVRTGGAQSVEDVTEAPTLVNVC